MLYYVRGSFIPNSQKLEVTRISLNWIMDTEILVHLHSVIQVLKNKDIMNFAGKWMERENIILSENTHTQKDINDMYSLSGY